jgi:hypothetical protein
VARSFQEQRARSGAEIVVQTSAARRSDHPNDDLDTRPPPLNPADDYSPQFSIDLLPLLGWPWRSISASLRYTT